MTITLTEDTNTFISLADAETYFSERLNVLKWEATGEEDKKKSLIMATKKIDTFAFIGQMQSSTQDLAFPRYVPRSTSPALSVNNIINDYITIETPTEVKEATCEEALMILESGTSKHLKNQQMGIKSMAMGNEAISYNGTGSNNKLLSQTARTLIDKWIQKGFNSAF